MTDGAVRVSVFGKSDLGRTREHNEDAFLVADLSAGAANLLPGVRDHELGERGSLFIVADGMGGAAAGEVASEMAINVIYEHLNTAWRSDSDPSPERFAFRLREAVDRANTEIYEYARANPEVRGMGTTLTAVGAMGADLYLAQIGDSRGYLVRGGEAVQLTRDQSLMQRLVDAGELTEEEAEQSERRNIILQALGPDPRVRVDLSRQTLRRGDTLLICSDGLSGVVRREELSGLVASEPNLPALCGALIDLANERGGPDNITVVAARFEGEGLAEPQGNDAVGYESFGDEDPTDATDVDQGVGAGIEISRDEPDDLVAQFDALEGRTVVDRHPHGRRSGDGPAAAKRAALAPERAVKDEVTVASDRPQSSSDATASSGGRALIVAAVVAVAVIALLIAALL